MNWWAYNCKLKSWKINLRVNGWELRVLRTLAGLLGITRLNSCFELKKWGTVNVITAY